MKPTSIRLLVTVAVIAGIFGWSAARLMDSLVGRYLPVTWTAAGAVWLLAAGLAAWTWSVRPRLQHREGSVPLESHVAARTTALALASSRTGAGVAGAYGGIVAAFLTELSIPAGRESALAAGLAALGGVAILAIGLWLERLCRVDEEDDDPEGGGAVATAGSAGD